MNEKITTSPVSLASMKRMVQALAEVEAPILANEAAIYFKAAMICEIKGLREAMRYFLEFHSEQEWAELLDSSQSVGSAHDAIADFLSRVEDIRLRSTGGKKVRRPKKSAE